MLTPEQIDSRIDARREAVIGYHRAVNDAMDKRENLLAATLFQPTIDRPAIEEHLELCRQQLFDATRHALIIGGFSLLTMTATCPGPQIMEDVELTLRITPRTRHSRNTTFPKTCGQGSTSDFKLSARFPVGCCLESGPTSVFPTRTSTSRTGRSPCR